MRLSIVHPLVLRAVTAVLNMQCITVVLWFDCQSSSSLAFTLKTCLEMEQVNIFQHLCKDKAFLHVQLLSSVNYVDVADRAESSACHADPDDGFETGKEGE